MFGTSVSAVKSRLHRARVALGQRMTAEAGQREARITSGRAMLSEQRLALK